MRKLRENDIKLLAFCRDVRRNVGEISNYLKIRPSSVSEKINQLEEEGLVVVTRKGWGKKTFVRTKEGIKTKEHYITLLKEVKRRKGISEEEFSNILPLDSFSAEEKDKFEATLSLPFIRPKLIDKKIFITPAGEKFLKENSK